MGAGGGTVIRWSTALAAAGLLVAIGLRAQRLAGAGGGELAGLAAIAGLVVLAGALDRRPAVCGVGMLVAAGAYAAAVWRAGGDGGAPLIAAALLGAVELARLSAELPPGPPAGALARRLGEVAAAAAAAAGTAWLVLAAGSARSPGGIAVTAAGLAATVAAVAMVVKLDG